MFEKVNPAHPDKIADRIAGAIVDMAYGYDMCNNPKISVEVLIGHGECHIMTESSVCLNYGRIINMVDRISPATLTTHVVKKPQDKKLADNQESGFKCGDNGIFRGMPITYEQSRLTKIAKSI
jgi:S-adenosylmethionine synthetase